MRNTDLEEAWQQNPFSRSKCTTCGHNHSASKEDLPIWEREAVEEKLRLDGEADVEAERLRLRTEAITTVKQRLNHPGRWMPWFKLVGSENGFGLTKMGEVWSCCGAREKSGDGCVKAQLSDLHTPCIRCGTKFYPFELPQLCRFHSGKLSWRDVDPTKFRWECCDRLASEEGCQTFSHHVH